MPDVGEGADRPTLRKNGDVDNCECQTISNGYSNLTVDEEVFSLMTSRSAVLESVLEVPLKRMSHQSPPSRWPILGGSREEPRNIKFEQFLIFE